MYIIMRKVSAVIRTPYRFTSVLIFVLHIVATRSEDNCPRPCRCDDQRQTVFCNGKSLIHVPFGIPKNTRILHLQGNELISSPSLDAVLSGLTELEKLDLTNNNLASFPRMLPSSLKQIILKSNDVKYIGKNALGNLNSLAVVRLDNNSITNEGLSRSAFSGAKNLTTLTLTNNKLTSIPSGLPRSLKLLHLNKNQISQIRVINLRGLSNLIRLDLSENKIFDEGIQENSFMGLTSLKNLDLGNNYLMDVPYNLPKSIAYLSLARNQIRYIYATHPDFMSYKKVGTFRDLTQLVQLDLSSNQLESIETDAFSNLDKLLMIRFHSNPWKCDCHIQYFLNFVSSSLLIKTDMRHIVCMSPPSLGGVTLNNLDTTALICDETKQNYSIQIENVASTSIHFNWSKTSSEVYPPFVRNFVMYGTLRCSETPKFYDCEEQLKDTKYVKKLLYVDGYKEIKSAYGSTKANTAVLENLIPDKNYVFCLFDSSNPPSKVTFNQCEKIRTLPKLSARGSDIIPAWIIVICTAFIFVVTMSGFSLAVCRKRKSGFLHKKNEISIDNSRVDNIQRQYVGQLLKKEGMLNETEVVMRGDASTLRHSENRKSTTLDAGKEFNFTLVNHKNGVRLSTISTATHCEALRNKTNNNDESFSSCKTTSSTIGSMAERPYFAFKTEPRFQENSKVQSGTWNQLNNEYKYDTRCRNFNNGLCHYSRNAECYYV